MTVSITPMTAVIPESGKQNALADVRVWSVKREHRIAAAGAVEIGGWRTRTLRASTQFCWLGHERARDKDGCA